MAQYEELSIDQGTDVAVEIRLANPDGSKKNLTDHSIDANIKRTFNTSDSDAVSFTAIVADPATDGIINLSLTNVQTAALTDKRYVYDVDISYVDSDANTVVERVLRGLVVVNPKV